MDKWEVVMNSKLGCSLGSYYSKLEMSALLLHSVKK